jgi:hypothetical protein
MSAYVRRGRANSVLHYWAAGISVKHHSLTPRKAWENVSNG